MNWGLQLTVTDLVEDIRQSITDYANKHLEQSLLRDDHKEFLELVSRCCSCTRSAIPFTWCNAPHPLDVQSDKQSHDLDVQGSVQTDLHRRAKITCCVCVCVCVRSTCVP